MDKDKGSKSAIDYMIQRALGILLSDLRRWKNDLHSVPFGIDSDTSKITEKKILLPELLLIFNLWRSARLLSVTLLESISVPSIWHRTTKTVAPTQLQGPIDWPKTFEHRQSGGSGFVVLDFGRNVAVSQAQYVALILCEFEIHCRLIIERITESTGPSMPKYLFEVISETEEIRAKTAGVLSNQYSEFKHSSSEKLEAAELALKKLLSNLDSATEPFFLEYQNLLSLKRPRGTCLANIVNNLTSWREDYLSCSVGINNNNMFEFRREGGESDLYEIWCFYEVCAAIKRSCLEEVVQLCVLRRRENEPHFRLSKHMYAYFDFHSLTFLPALDPSTFDPRTGIKSTMPGVFVEWFIRNLNDYQKSICLDTKFAKWNSREILKVLGYMVNFGIQNGVVILKDVICQSTLNSEEIIPGFHKVYFPDDRTLFVLSLIPDQQNEIQNRQILDRFVQDLFQSEQE